jgi:hypothetical protein
MSPEYPHNDLHSRLDRMEGKLDSLQETIILLARIEERQNFQSVWNERQSVTHADLYMRVQALEKFQWKLAGALLIVAMVAGYVLPTLMKWLTGVS